MSSRSQDAVSPGHEPGFFRDGSGSLPWSLDLTPVRTSAPNDPGSPPPASPSGEYWDRAATEANPCLHNMPNEVLYGILGHLDVDDLLSTSRTNHHLRHLSLAPILHAYRLRQIRFILPPLLTSRSPLADLISRSIFLTHTSVVSRRLGRSLVSIRLAKRLATRPSPEELVNRAVLPPECVPGKTAVHVAPALVAKRRAVEKERVKDGLRHWVGDVWRGKVMQREEGVKQSERRKGVGRVWRLRKFWERVSRGEVMS